MVFKIEKIAIIAAWKHLNKNIRRRIIIVFAFVLFTVAFFGGVIFYEKNQSVSSTRFTTSNYGFVQYPVFENIDGSEQINDLIKDKVESIIDINQKFAGNIQYSVLECNLEIISIEFYGDLVFVPTRKPSRIYSCISIDVKNLKQIKLNDIVQIDESFVKKYSESLYLKYQELHPNTARNPFGENGSYSMEYLEYFLNKADELVYDKHRDRYFDSNIKTYIHENNIILSMELPQAIGYHIEVEMPIDEIKQTN